MIDLKKVQQKIVLETDLQFDRKEDEDALTAFIEVVFNGHKIGAIRHTVRARVSNGQINGYDYFYNYFSYNQVIKVTWEYRDLPSIKDQIKEEIEKYIENTYLLFNLPKPEVKIDEETLFDNSEEELRKLTEAEYELTKDKLEVQRKIIDKIIKS